MYFLDGESILETTLSYFRLLSPRMKGRVLQLCLLVGTIISVFAFLRIFLATILQAWGWYIIPSFLIFLSVLYFTSFTYCAIPFIFCFNIDHAAMCDTGGVSLSRKPHVFLLRVKILHITNLKYSPFLEKWWVNDDTNPPPILLLSILSSIFSLHHCLIWNLPSIAYA